MWVELFNSDGETTNYFHYPFIDFFTTDNFFLSIKDPSPKAQSNIFKGFLLFN